MKKAIILLIILLTMQGAFAIDSTLTPKEIACSAHPQGCYGEHPCGRQALAPGIKQSNEWLELVDDKAYAEAKK